jgi:hypothetical protein
MRLPSASGREKAREALAVMKEDVAIQKRLAADASARLLTDVTGPNTRSSWN